MDYPYETGVRVVATRRITEGGTGCPGSLDAKYPSPSYIHADKGDVGTVVLVSYGFPDVTWPRHGTTIVAAPWEVEAILN